MKFCYLIQTHKNPQQIYRLIHLLKRLSPHCQIIVSHDFKHCNLDLSPLKNLSGVEVLNSPGGRGNFSLLQAYLDAIDWLFRENIDFDWLINLSGQDYPTQPLSQFENELAQTSYDGFIEYFEVFSKQSHWSIREGYSRYCYKHQQLRNNLNEDLTKLLKPFKIVNYIQPFFRLNFSYGVTLGIKRKALFDDKFICYGGSFFCILSRKCIQYLYDFCISNIDVVNYYRGVLNPDESFIQTVLINSQLFNLCNDYKRYIDFSRSRDGHPRILTTNDYPSLVQSHIHFARKFDIEQDSNILDLLDTRILQSPQSSSHSANSV